MSSVLIIMLALASVWDVVLHRIPNAVTVGIAATGLVAGAMSGGVRTFGASVLAGIVVGAALWPGWTRRWIGGGDLKLAAASATWLGIARLPSYLLVAAVAVGVLSLVSYVRSERTVRCEMRRNLACALRVAAVSAPITAHRGRAQVPAGAGFAIAAVVVLAMTGGL